MSAATWLTTLSLHSTWDFSNDSFWLVFHQHALCKVWLSKKSLTARGEVPSADGLDYLETFVSQTILSSILQWLLTLSGRSKGNNSGRKVSQCHKSEQYQWNTNIAINKQICQEIKITVSNNDVMLYFASLYLMLKCSTPTGKNVHLLQKRIAEAF